MNVRERIIQLVQESGMTQKEFAAAISAPVTTVNGWFKKDNKSPSTEYIIPICELFHVSPDWLLTGEGDKEPPARLPSRVELSSIDFAIYGDTRDLSEYEKQDILDYIRFKKAQKEQRK